MKLRVLDETLQWWRRGEWFETQWDDWESQLKVRGSLQVFLDLAGECLSGSELIWEEEARIDALLVSLSECGFRVVSVVSAQSLLASVSDDPVGWTYALGSLNRCCIYQKGRGLQSFVYKNEAQKLTYLQQVSADLNPLDCPIKPIDMQALIVESHDLESSYAYHSLGWGRLKKHQRWHRVQFYLAVAVIVSMCSVWMGVLIFQDKVVGSYKKIPHEIRDNLSESQAELNHRKEYENFLKQSSLPEMAECWLLLSQDLQEHPNIELSFIHLKAQSWRLKGQVKGYRQYAEAEQALNAWLLSIPNDLFKVKKEVHYETSQVLAFEVEFDWAHSGGDTLVCLASVD